MGSTDTNGIEIDAWVMQSTKYFYKTTQLKFKVITLNRVSFKLICRTFLIEF